jgi:two-component system, probable response regulator PhcQ
MNSGIDYKSHALLFVDDEEQARKYFRMAFEEDFQVLTAPGVEEAWQLIAAGAPPVGVVITDQRMPKQAGTDLLGRVRRTHPGIVRILTTAHADLDAAIDAVNSGAIFRYLVKPWDIRELRVTLRHAMEYFLLRRERDILLREKLSSLEHMLVADRVRSLAILAEGLSGQIRNTMTALSAYVELAREKCQRDLPTAAALTEEHWRNLQWETEDATRHLLKFVQGVAAATFEPRDDFGDSVELAALLESAWPKARGGRSSVTLELDVARELPKLACNRATLERMFVNLFSALLGPAREEGGKVAPVRVVARELTKVWGADGVTIQILRSGFDEASLKPLFMPAWAFATEADSPDLLAAFFAAHHHGGTVGIENGASAGNGFRVALPFQPSAVTRPALDELAAEKLFSQLPRWEALERGG